jgi:hypothetical protein
MLLQCTVCTTAQPQTWLVEDVPERVIPFSQHRTYRWLEILHFPEAIKALRIYGIIRSLLSSFIRKTQRRDTQSLTKRRIKKAAVDSPSLLNITINPSQDNMCTIMPAPILGQTWTRLHSRWSSSSRDIFDKPPSKPLSCRRMSEGRPSSAASVKESHQEDPGTSKVRRPHQSDSMWTSGGAGTTTVRPPLLRGKAFRWTSGGTGTTTVRPPLRRGKAFKRFLQGACRWTSSSRSALDRVPTPAPAPHRMIVGSSSVSALKPSVEMKDRDIFEIAQMALCIFNVPGKPPASIKSPVCCLPPRMTTHAPIITENALTPPTSMTPHSPVVSKRAYAA